VSVRGCAVRCTAGLVVHMAECRAPCRRAPPLAVASQDEGRGACTGVSEYRRARVSTETAVTPSCEQWTCVVQRVPVCCKG